MSAAHKAPDLSGENIQLGDAGETLRRVAFGAGVLGILATGFLASTGGEETWQRSMLSYLTNYMYWLSIMLGALFFVLIQHATRAGWSVVVRRIAETFAANGLLMAVLATPILVLVFMGGDPFFEWTNEKKVASYELLQHKSPYLNVNFFMARMVFYLAVWALLGTWYHRMSVRQDETGDPKLTGKMQWMAGPGLYLFAITLTFCAIDLMMSLEPTWFSTMFGVYYFAGSALSFFAILPIVAFALQRSGRLQKAITPEHFHDMGKLIFAFIVFWAYIAFSQYMLIWYANIPEETQWFLARQTGEWEGLSWFLLFGHFVLPFFALMSRFGKRRPQLLIIGAAWILLVHWADMYYVIMPHASPGKLGFALTDLTAFVGLGGLFLGAFLTRVKGHSLIPQRDPRLAESLAFENF